MKRIYANNMDWFQVDQAMKILTVSSEKAAKETFKGTVSDFRALGWRVEVSEAMEQMYEHPLHG